MLRAYWSIITKEYDWKMKTESDNDCSNNTQTPCIYCNQCKIGIVLQFLRVLQYYFSSYRHHHHHHQVALTAQSYLTLSLSLSRHLSLSFIVSSRSFRLHPMSAQSLVVAGRPTLASLLRSRVHNRTSLISSSQHLQRCSISLVRLTSMVYKMGGRCPLFCRVLLPGVVQNRTYHSCLVHI